MRRLLGATPELAVATAALLDLQPESITADTIQGALDLFKSHSLSWWDSLILSSARKAGCKTIYSEDMQAGSLIGGVKIVNPFQREAALPLQSESTAPLPHYLWLRTSPRMHVSFRTPQVSPASQTAGINYPL